MRSNLTLVLALSLFAAGLVIMVLVTAQPTTKTTSPECVCPLDKSKAVDPEVNDYEVERTLKESLKRL